MPTAPSLFLGSSLPLSGAGEHTLRHLPAHHLVTHGVIVGMTGSGKTGLITVTVEEALRCQVPVLVIDVKGDLPNLLLAFPSFEAASLVPWAASTAPPDDLRAPAEIAAELAHARQQALQGWGLGERELGDFHAGTEIRVITPGSTAGEPLHVL